MKNFLLFVFCFGLLVSVSNTCLAQIIINEITYNPSGTDTGYEWIEVYNSGSADIDMVGWKFTESGTDHGLVMKQGTTQIPAGGFAIIVDDITNFQSVYNFSGTIFDSTFSLSNDGEPLAIKDSNKVEIDSVAYLKSQGAYGNGNSLQKNGSTWISAVPTPGAVNANVDSEPVESEDSGETGDGSATTTATSTGVTATTTATSTTTTASTNSGGSSYYVYSGSVSLSTYEPLNLSVEAGRERLTYLHTPIEFKAYAKDRATGKSVSGARYYWTFGDGASAEGAVVKHSYLFPGEYNVVLNSSSGEDDAVDITKVKVIMPQVKMTYADPYVEFVNENSLDLNIGEWKIKGNDKEYLIPKDTIVSAFGNLKIPASILGAVFGSEKLSVVYPDNQLAFESSRISSIEKQKQITEITQKLAVLQDELYLAYTNEGDNSQFTGDQSSRLIGEGDVKKVEGESFASGDVNGSVANSISSPVSQSVLSKIVDFFATMFR